MRRPRARPTFKTTEMKSTNTFYDRNSAQVSSSPDRTSNHGKKTKGCLLSANCDYQTHHPNSYTLCRTKRILPMQTTNWKNTPSPVSYFLIGIKLLPKNKTATATPIYPRTVLSIIKNGDLKSSCDTIRGFPVISSIINLRYQDQAFLNRYVYFQMIFKLIESCADMIFVLENNCENKQHN